MRNFLSFLMATENQHLARKYISMKLNFIRFFLHSCGVYGECECSFTQFYWAFSFDSINAVYVAYICFDIYTFSIENIQPSPTSYVVCSISATDIAVLKSNIICIFWVVITPSSYTFKGKQTTQIRLTTHQQNETTQRRRSTMAVSTVQYSTARILSLGRSTLFSALLLCVPHKRVNGMNLRER